jgi:hypothetical protein
MNVGFLITTVTPCIDIYYRLDKIGQFGPYFLDVCDTDDLFGVAGLSEPEKKERVASRVIAH